MDFGDLTDETMKEKLTKFHESVEKIGKIVELCSNTELYEKLTTKEKVDFDLFMVYTLNTLFWLYLKTKGQDPNKSEIKNQLKRVKEYMVKAKEAVDRQNRPRINQAVAGRFIKHGIHHSDNRKEDKGPPNKKIKFSD